MKHILITILAFLLTVSCARGASSRGSEKDERDTIEMPEIPSNLREPTERADYLITHFWDKLDFTDTVKTHDRALMEQSFVNFLSILPYASTVETVKNGFAILLDRAGEDTSTFDFFTRTANDYLSDPDSPMHSEEVYLLYLDVLKDNRNLTPSERIRIEDRIEMVSKNRKGTAASDFSYKTADGKESTLYKTLTPGKDMLLIFFDPECENCEEVMRQMQKNESLNNNIKEGKLQILAIYSGENEEAWLKKAERLPANWTVGINMNEIEDNELYYLPTMPTIYLLDDGGIVMEKDLQLPPE